MITSLPLLGWPLHRQALTILVYHRVLTEWDPLRQGELVAEVFDEQVHFLSKNFAVLPLLEAVSLLKQGKLPRRACCITFDDGYADNLTVALPILKQYDLPATVFIATGYLDGQRMFNDAVIDAIALAERPELDLRELDLGQHCLETQKDRQLAVVSILRKFRYRTPEAREQALPQLFELVGCDRLSAGTMLSRDQVRDLAGQGVEIGAHTVNHPILTSIDDNRAMDEMISGKLQLEELTGRPVKVFAYPNGQPHKDYALRHVAMARDAGFELAVTTARGVSNPHSDIFQLPRFAPWGISEARWAVQLTKNAWIGKAVAQC